MSSNPYFKKPAPTVGKAAHKVVQKTTPPGKPQPKPGFHPKGGANASTVVSDTGSPYTNQQQQTS